MQVFIFSIFLIEVFLKLKMVDHKQDLHYEIEDLTDLNEKSKPVSVLRPSRLPRPAPVYFHPVQTVRLKVLGHRLSKVGHGFLGG